MKTLVLEKEECLRQAADRISQLLTEHDSLPAEIDKTEDNE